MRLGWKRQAWQCEALPVGWLVGSKTLRKSHKLVVRSVVGPRRAVAVKLLQLMCVSICMYISLLHSI